LQILYILGLVVLTKNPIMPFLFILFGTVHDPTGFGGSKRNNKHFSRKYLLAGKIENVDIIGYFGEIR